MPLDYTAIQQQIHTLTDQFSSRATEQEQKAARAAILLDSLTGSNSDVREIVFAAVSADNHLRCAIPTDEEISASFAPPSTMPVHTLLAADGSQVNPNRHDPIPFGVINIGVFHMDSSLHLPPREIVETHLLSIDELYADGHLAGEEVVALRRDLRERQMLVRLAAEIKGTVITLTDGPLELFRDPQGGRETQHEFEQYMGVLRELAGQGTITAGYVDRPGSDLVVRMLGLVDNRTDSSSPTEKVKTFAPLSDSLLFEDRLPPHHRSAVFSIQSQSAQSFSDETALHFFYMNTGKAGSPSLARVEIPAWVAEDREKVNILHAVLLDQCSHLGGTPYPYALHRSHEIALVSLPDKEQVENMITRALISRGMTPPAPSNKQFAKNLAGRMRNR